MSTGAAQLLPRNWGDGHRRQKIGGKEGSGWPLATADSEQGDEEVIDWMVKVTQLAWERRYHSRQTVTDRDLF